MPGAYPTSASRAPARLYFLAICLFATLSAAQAEDVTGYAWRARLTGDFATGQLHKVMITPDVADRLESFPLDVRVVDEKGVPWPALLWAADTSDIADPVSTTRVGENLVRDEQGIIRHLLAVQPDRFGNGAPAHNRAIVSISGSEFQREVEVWSGERADALTFRARALILERSSPFAVRKRTIDYPASTDAFVELRIHEDARSPRAPLSLRAIELVHVQESAASVIHVKAQLLDPPPGEPSDGSVRACYFDTGSRHLPLAHLDLTISGKGVFPVRVHGRANADQSWRWIGDGVVVDHEAGPQQRIHLDRSAFRYLKIELHADGQEAPAVEEARAGLQAHYLVFRPSTISKAFFYAGAPVYKLPGSTFLRMVNADTVREARDAALARLQENPARKAQSLDRYGNMLFRLGGVIVLMLIMLVLVRKIRDRFL